MTDNIKRILEERAKKAEIKAFVEKVKRLMHSGELDDALLDLNLSLHKELRVLCKDTLEYVDSMRSLKRQFQDWKNK